MRFFAITMVLICTLGSCFKATAQTSTSGTEFWLAYQENLNLLFNDAPIFTIVVHADAPTNGTIEAVFTGSSIPFSVPAGSTEVVLFPAVLYPNGSDVSSNFGIRISTDNQVQLSAFHYRSFFCEASSVYPITELGTRYRITTPTEEAGNNQPNSFVVAATQDGTNIEIIPSALTLGLFPAGVPINVSLDAGQTYQVQSNGDLTNSLITSNGQPVAVFAGAREANMDENCFGGANSHVWDQVPPTDHYNDLYYFVPFNNQNGDVVKILALEDNTEVFFDCDLEVVLNAGDSHRVFLNQAVVISATNAISITQYNTEGGCNTQNLGDPNGLNYLPAALRSNSFRWFATDRTRTSNSPTYFTQHALTVIAPASAQNDIELDGNPLGGFLPFSGDPSMVYTSLVVSSGAHQLVSNSDAIQAYAYGFNEFDAYTMNLGYTVNEDVNFVCGCDPSTGSTQITANVVGCPNDTTSFTFTSTYPNLGAFYWVIAGDTIFDEVFTYDYVFEDPGEYVVEVVVLTIDGCAYPDEILITIPNCTDPCFGFEPSPVFPKPFTTCVDSTVELSVIAQNDVGVYDSIRWRNVDQGILEFGDTISFAPSQIGNLTLEVQFFLSNGCVFDYSYTLVVTECGIDCNANPPTVILDEVNPYCLDSIATFSVMIDTTTVGLEGVPQWTSLTTGQVVNGFVVETVYNTIGSHPWTLSFSLENGCDYTFEGFATSLVIDCDTVNNCSNPPEIDLVLRDSMACVDSSLFLELILLNANGYLFDSTVYVTDDGQRFVGDSWDNLVFNSPGLKRAQAFLYSTDGCIFTDSLTFLVETCPIDTFPPAPSCMLYWPSAFSPNLDGTNDVFKPFFEPICEPTNYQLQIYDRWGGTHFLSNDPNQGWDGTSNGKKMNTGVYIYLATYQLPDGSLKTKAGDLTLLR